MAVPQAQVASGQQTAEVLQKRFFMLLCDYRSKGEQQRERAVPTNVYRPHEQNK
jgi:hypothetical protein